MFKELMSLPVSCPRPAEVRYHGPVSTRSEVGYISLLVTSVLYIVLLLLLLNYSVSTRHYKVILVEMLL